MTRCKMGFASAAKAMWRGRRAWQRSPAPREKNVGARGHKGGACRGPNRMESCKGAGEKWVGGVHGGYGTNAHLLRAYKC
jgi:hypothetical protein